MTNTVNPNKYKVEFSSLESIQELVTKAQTPTALPQIFDAAEEAVQAVKEKASLWTTIVSFFATLFGKVSDYQRLMIEVERLESKLQKKTIQLLSSPSETDSNEATQLANKLAEAKEEIRALGAKITSDLNNLITKFDEVNDQLAGLERLCNKENPSKNQLLQNMGEASQVAQFLKDIQTSIDATSQMYYDNADHDFTPILILTMRYEQFENRLEAIRQKQQFQLDSEITLASNPLRGIQNGLNTCYLASAMHTINAIASYRKVFDPQLNPLKPRSEETQESFEQRLAIQKLGFHILQNVQCHQLTTQGEINAFRAACYNHKQIESDETTRVVEDLEGTGDATEFLGNLLKTMDYPFGSYQVAQTRKIPTTAIPVIRYDIEDVASVRTLEDFSKEYLEIRDSSPQVSPHGYLDKFVDMQLLIDKTWTEEQIECNFWIHDLDDAGKPCIKEYNQYLLHSKAVNAPEVIEVRVAPKEYENYTRATITKADKIFPFGNGHGPEYELKAIIEHRHLENHYVAHITQKDGPSIKADDSLLLPDTEKDFPGVAYYYVKVESKA